MNEKIEEQIWRKIPNFGVERESCCFEFGGCTEVVVGDGMLGVGWGTQGLN